MTTTPPPMLQGTLPPLAREILLHTASRKYADNAYAIEIVRERFPEDLMQFKAAWAHDKSRFVDVACQVIRKRYPDYFRAATEAEWVPPSISKRWPGAVL